MGEADKICRACFQCRECIGLIPVRLLVIQKGQGLSGQFLILSKIIFTHWPDQPGSLSALASNDKCGPPDVTPETAVGCIGLPAIPGL